MTYDIKELVEKRDKACRCIDGTMNRDSVYILAKQFAPIISREDMVRFLSYLVYDAKYDLRYQESFLDKPFPE